ncbi:hypothetical protein PGQ11_000018 [Apiospora arundinis]
MNQLPAVATSRRAALLIWGAAMLATPSIAENNVCSYDGGWSLRVDSRYCPSNAPIDCGMGTQRRCCPSGYVCAGVGLQGGSWCCKEGEDCINQARESPRCPNQQWTLWGGDDGSVSDGAWCCQPGYNGFYKGKVEGVGCTKAGVNTLPSNTFFAKTVLTSQCVTSTPTPSSSSSSSATIGQTTPTGSVVDGQNAGGEGQQSSKDDDSSSSKGLGSGAIAGIVIGCVAGVALIAAIFGAAMWRRRKNRAAAGQELHSNDPAHSQSGYYPTSEMHHAGGGGGGGYADSSVGGYSGSTAGGGYANSQDGRGYYAPSPGQQGYAEPQMKENTIYSPPAELPNENRHLIGDQRAESHEMP